MIVPPYALADDFQARARHTHAVNDTQARLNLALSGRYVVERPLGQGGMAVVFLAEDLRHRRKVALKVLKPEAALSLGAERFLREAEIIGRLAHPHILPLFVSGDADGLLYYVMPYVEGQSLRDRLDVARLPLDEAVRLLRDIADALAWAHRHGVIHRDIKPENVMLSGRHALVADFGIARSVSGTTTGAHSTTTGVVLGTPAYMSPEQLLAEPTLDHRTDIYSFGVLAYEVLTGRPPFSDSGAAAVIGGHLGRRPPPIPKSANVPAPLAELVMRCLEKDPAKRPQDAAELVDQLEHQTAGGSSWRTRGLAAAVVVMAATAGIFAWQSLGARRLVTIGRTTVIASGEDLELSPSLSPDGRFVAYVAGSSYRLSLWVRPADGSRPVRLTSDSIVATVQPRWSPDGSRILFATQDGLWTVPALGGPARQVVESGAGTLLPGDWSPDGRHVAFERGDSVLVVAVEGGTPRLVGTAREVHSCDWSRSGKWIACVSENSSYVRPGALLGNITASQVVLFPSDGGPAVPLTTGTALHQSPAWGARDDELWYVSDEEGSRDLYRMRLARGLPSGAPRKITTDLNAHSVDVSADGQRVVYSVFSSQANVWTLPIPHGPPMSVTMALKVTFENQTIESMTVTRDGRWMVYDSDLSGTSDVYRMPLPEGEVERLTSDPGGEFRPELSPDGRWLAFHASRDGTRDIFVQSLNGGAPVRLTSSPAQEGRPTWSPDGQRLAFVDLRPPGAVFVMSRGAGDTWNPPVRVDSGGITPDFGCVPAPDWTASGSGLVYCYDGEIRLLQLTGGVRTLYTPDRRRHDPLVAWVRAGVEAPVAYFRGHRDSGEDGIWAMPLAGGAPRLVVRFDDPVRPSPLPFFAVDRASLYFTRSDRQSDIRLASLERP